MAKRLKLLETCESFFFRSNRIGRPICFRIESSNRIGSIPRKPQHSLKDCRRPYSLLQAYNTLTTSIVNGILYFWRTRVMYGLCNSELSTCLFLFSHKTRQTMLLYAYFTPKVDFKRTFNHHQSFLYDMTIDSADDSKISNRTINTNRMSNRTYDSKSNRITKLRRSLKIMRGALTFHLT